MKRKRMKRKTFSFNVTVWIFILSAVGCGDLFVNTGTKEKLTGYAVERSESGSLVVQSVEKGMIEINPAQWEMTYSRQGRNNLIIVITLDRDMTLEIMTEAFEESMQKAVRGGPLFILLEIDTPGGGLTQAKRICTAIGESLHCPVIGYIYGGEFGGAISAGAGVALACDKIYMASNATIGSATVITFDQSGAKDMKDVYGDVVGEKFNSSWRAYLGALAENNNRSAMLARAMVDKDIEVVEVEKAGKRKFVDPVNVTADQRVVRTWSKKGSLLTMTAVEAVEAGIADRIANSRAELLKDMDAKEARVVFTRDIELALKEYDRAEKRAWKLVKDLDLQFKQLQTERYKPRAMSMIRRMRDDYKQLIRVAQRYPDLNIDVNMLNERLNTIEAAYQQAKQQHRR